MAKRDYRLPLLVAILVVATATYAWRMHHSVSQARTPAEHLREAERLHAEGAAKLDPVLLQEARKHYRRSIDPVNAVANGQAQYGCGQVNLLLGDTDAAIAEWTTVSLTAPDTFQRLRAMKTAGDALWDSRRGPEAAEWYRQILANPADSPATQAVAILVAAARRRLDDSATLSTIRP